MNGSASQCAFRTALDAEYSRQNCLNDLKDTSDDLNIAGSSLLRGAIHQIIKAAH